MERAGGLAQRRPCWARTPGPRFETGPPRVHSSASQSRSKNAVGIERLGPNRRAKVPSATSRRPASGKRRVARRRPQPPTKPTSAPGVPDGGELSKVMLTGPSVLTALAAQAVLAPERLGVGGRHLDQVAAAPRLGERGVRLGQRRARTRSRRRSEGGTAITACRARAARRLRSRPRRRPRPSSRR